MSQGTRCHQLATYVIFESPLNMLCDNPSNYNREPECTEFIANIPTVWEKTVALDGKVGEYVAIARLHGDNWYVGALTNWDAREVELDLSFWVMAIINWNCLKTVSMPIVLLAIIKRKSYRFPPIAR